MHSIRVAKKGDFGKPLLDYPCSCPQNSGFQALRQHNALWILFAQPIDVMHEALGGHDGGVLLRLEGLIEVFQLQVLAH